MFDSFDSLNGNGFCLENRSFLLSIRIFFFLCFYIYIIESHFLTLRQKVNRLTFIAETIQSWYMALGTVHSSQIHIFQRRAKNLGKKMQYPLNLKTFIEHFSRFVSEYFIENSFELENIEILIDYGPLNIWVMLKIKYAFYASFYMMQTEFQTIVLPFRLYLCSWTLNLHSFPICVFRQFHCQKIFSIRVDWQRCEWTGRKLWWKINQR